MTVNKLLRSPAEYTLHCTKNGCHSLFVPLQKHKEKHSKVGVWHLPWQLKRGLHLPESGWSIHSYSSHLFQTSAIDHLKPNSFAASISSLILFLPWRHPHFNHRYHDCNYHPHHHNPKDIKQVAANSSFQRAWAHSLAAVVALNCFIMPNACSSPKWGQHWRLTDLLPWLLYNSDAKKPCNLISHHSDIL